MYFRQILFIFLISVTGIYFLITTYQKIESDSAEKLYEEQNYHAKHVSDYLQTSLARFGTYLNYLSKRNEIIELNKEGKELIKNFYNLHNNELKTIALIDSTGTIYYSYPSNKNLIGRNIFVNKRNGDLAKNHKPVISAIIRSPKDYMRITYYYPMLKNNIFVGGIGILVPYDILTKEALKGIKIKETGYAWVIDQEGNILFHPSPKYQSLNAFNIYRNSLPAMKMLENAVIGRRGNAEFQTIISNENKPELVSYYYYPVPVESGYWSVIISIPKKEAFLMTKGALTKLIIIFAFLTLVIVIYLYYVIKARTVLKEEVLRKKAEHELIISESKFRNLVELSPDAIIFSDIHGKIIFTNQMAAKLAGYEKSDELIGRDSLEFIAPEDKVRAVENLIKTLDEGSTREFQYSVLRQDGSFYPAEINTSVIYDTDNKPLGFIGILRDITARKKIEQNLLDAKEAAEKSDKFKSDFLAQMSHEIRSPINAILSFAALLEDEISHLVPEDLKSSFSTMRKSGKRIIRTIDLILNMSELQTGLFEPSFRTIKLKSEILDQVYMEFRQSAKEKGLDFSLMNLTGFNDLNVTGDEYTLGQIFNNLVNNAIKFTEKGSIEIIMSVDEEEKAVIKVIDTGIGISEKYLDNIFRPFSQEEQGYSRRYEGNGLGLALVKKYCEINNASIVVESKKDVGTVFTVTFCNSSNNTYS